MAARRPIPARTIAASQTFTVDDPQVSRALDALRTSVERLEGARQRAVLTVDLIVGLNKIPHGLGRAVMGYTVTATVASAAFAHAIDLTNPRPDLELWLTAVGIAMPGAVVEVF